MLFLLTVLLTQVSARVLTKDVLLEGPLSQVGSAVDNSEFLPSPGIVPTRPSVTLDGYLNITYTSQHFFNLIWVDSDPSTAYPQPFDTMARRTLPNSYHQYVQDGFDLLPVVQGYINNPSADSDHPWEYILSPSRCWHENTDGQYVRCVIVFAITEFHQNALFNGLMTFLVHPGTLQTSKLWYQVNQGGCAYYQGLWSGFANITFVPQSTSLKQSVLYSHNQWSNKRMSVKSVLDLAPEGSGWVLENNPLNYYPDHADCSPVDPYTFSLGYYGVVLDDTLYEGITATYTGPHPYPQYVVHPSYSLAKSNFVSLTVGVLDTYGCNYLESPSSTVTKCVLDLTVSNWVQQADTTWSNITLRDLINMADNHYNSSTYGVDEGSLRQNIEFFYSYTFQEKLTFSLGAFNYHPETVPGTKFSYHTTNFYLAGVMLQEIIDHTFDVSLLEFYRDNVCDVLDLSDMYCKLRVTRGVPQPISGYGAFMYSNDIAKLTQFWTYGGPLISQQYYLNAMQRGTETGVPTLRSHDPLSTCYPKSSRMVTIPNQKYNLGFWSDNTLGEDYAGVGVTCPTKLVYGSGYGGQRMVIAYQRWGFIQLGQNYDFLVHRAVSTLSQLFGCPL